jgi:hypothetical protein
MITRKIANQLITLRIGKRYRASRPMAKRGQTAHQVTITNLKSGETPVIIPALTISQANALINEFNNGPTSFTGRVW